MSAVLQLIEVKVSRIGIGHQCTLEIAKKLFDNLLSPATIQIITNLRGQIDYDPHIPSSVMNLAIGFRHLGVNPRLITIDCGTRF